MSLRSAAKLEGVPENRDSMMDYFTSRIRKNLHVALCFSPVGELFRLRARRFPGYVGTMNSQNFIGRFYLH